MLRAFTHGTLFFRIELLYFENNFCVSVQYFLFVFGNCTILHTCIKMVKTKKTSLENKDYCKRYRENNEEGYRKNDRERKQLSRMNEKTLDSEKYQ